MSTTIIRDKALYRPSTANFSVVDVPSMNFLAIDGEGDPNVAPAYKDAIQALFTLSYGIKFAAKKELALDYKVFPLEGLWWAEDMASFTSRAKSQWLWTMMIRQPEGIPTTFIENQMAITSRKKPLPAISKVRFETYHEGLSVHIGSYDAEGPTLQRLHQEYLPQHGYEPLSETCP